MLDVLRQTISDRIAVNPVTIIADIRPRITNAQGKSIEDITVAAVPTELGVGTVSRRRLPEPIVTNAKTPYDYQDVYYLIVEYDTTWLRRNLVFSHNGETFRTKLPEKKYLFGGVAYIVCGLEQITARDIGDY